MKKNKGTSRVDSPRSSYGGAGSPVAKKQGNMPSRLASLKLRRSGFACGEETRKIIVFLFLLVTVLPYCLITCLHAEDKAIALTFHDGPNPKATLKLLKILKDADIKATFFVVGKMVDKYPELLKAIYEDGHEIAGHTYNHKNLTKLSTTELISELSRTRLIIKDVTGVDGYLYTPPGGQYDEKVIKTANSCGYIMALWSVFPEDHRNPSPIIYEKVVANAKDGSVVLLHNGPVDTVDALPKIIEKLKARDFKFITLAELLSENKGKHIVYPRD